MLTGYRFVAYGVSHPSHPNGSRENHAMKNFLLTILAGLSIAGPLLTFTPAQAGDFKIKVSGGPTGGTFNVFANAMAIYLPKHMDDIKVTIGGSDGSVENVKRVSSGKYNFGLCYAVDLALGREGKLSQDKKTYDGILALGFLYGAPAQLVVRADSDIHTARDLAGKTVAVGDAGSGSAASAERFFGHLGIWDDLDHPLLSYAAAVNAFKEGEIDAFWDLVGYPNRAIIQASIQVDIRLIEVGKDAEESGFFDTYTYVPIEIPAGTYDEEMPACASFQDHTLLCTNKDVPVEIVYEIMKNLWSKDGLKAMMAAKKTFRPMSLATGFTGTTVPLHPGAVRFWEEQDRTVPDHLK
jgi:TRAP transporter TAXI family solute receptor